MIYLTLVVLLLAPGAIPSDAATAKVLAIEPLTPNVKRLRVRLPRQYSFEAGQFALLSVPSAYLEEWNSQYKTKHREIRRPYSFASSPKRLPVAEFIIQLAAPPPGRSLPPGVASTYIHSRLKPGDTIEISEPVGTLGQISGTRPILLVAGGSGVAPFAGLLDHWFRTKQHKGRRIYLFLGVRQRRDLILDADLRRWAAKHANFAYVPALSDPAPDDQWTGATGFINAVIDRQLPGPLDAEVLLAGSPRMMQEAEKTLRAKGVPASQIRHDPITVSR